MYFIRSPSQNLPTKIQIEVGGDDVYSTHKLSNPTLIVLGDFVCNVVVTRKNRSPQSWTSHPLKNPLCIFSHKYTTAIWWNLSLLYPNEHTSHRANIFMRWIILIGVRHVCCRRKAMHVWLPHYTFQPRGWHCPPSIVCSVQTTTLYRLVN